MQTAEHMKDFVSTANQYLFVAQKRISWSL